MKRSLLLGCALLGFCAGFASAGDSLLQNGNFEKPLKPWKVFSIKGSPATEKEVAEGVLIIKAADASDGAGNRQVMQEVAVEAGKTYSLIFDVKGAPEKGSEFPVVITKGPGKFVYFNRVEATSEWTTKKLKITPKESDGTKPTTLKFLLGKLKGELSFRNVSLKLVE